MKSSGSSKSTLPHWLRVVAIVVIVAVWFASQREAKIEPKPVPSETKPVSVKVVGSEAAEKSDGEGAEVREGQATGESQLVVRSVILKDESGRVVYRGDVDLAPTLERIAAKRLLDRFPNDGNVFQNRERRLPKQPSGYYREYVVPTPDERGPGPQRLVIGRDGETYYTHDHYRTFRKLR